MAVPWVRAHVRRTCTARLDRDLVRGEPRGPSVRATMTQALRWLGLVSFLGVTLACSSSNSSGSGVGNDGGGGSGGTSGDAGDSVSQICAAVAELPCSSLKDPEACKDLLQQQQQHAETAGCGAENQALYDCRAAHPDVCNNGQQSTNPECSAAESAVYECAKAAPNARVAGSLETAVRHAAGAVTTSPNLALRRVATGLAPVLPGPRPGRRSRLPGTPATRPRSTPIVVEEARRGSCGRDEVA